MRATQVSRSSLSTLCRAPVILRLQHYSTATQTANVVSKNEKIWRRNPMAERAVLEDIGKAMNISDLSQWYSVSRSEIERRGGKGLFIYHASVEQLLRSAYPEYPWKSSDFAKPKQVLRRWAELNVQKQFLENAGRELGVTQMSDWYQVTHSAIIKRGGSGLFSYYASLGEALRAVYPGFPWELDKFQSLQGRTPSGYWKDKSNLIEALEKAEAKIGIKKPEDWYSVTMTELREIGFPYNFTKLQLADLLAEQYPDVKWEKVFLLRGRFAQQKRLERAVHQMFPDTEIIVNARKEAELLNPDTNEFLELDIWIPSLKLAFEYQEKHHYTESEYTFKPIEKIKERDEQKKALAEMKGITLIQVPFWWDGQMESLAATVQQKKPELVQGLEIKIDAAPIREQPPPQLLEKQVPEIADIGHPITACFMTTSSVDPTNWWMFEKYDGVRGFWNPVKGTMFSRRGNEIRLPENILNALPRDIFLDGELWFGRDNFQEALKLSNKVDWTLIDWKSFKFMVFDVPDNRGNYQERYQTLAKYFEEHPCEYVEAAPYEKCMGMTHMERFFQDMMDKGGEGVILRDPLSAYTAGRSGGYLKHKKFRDAEAKIVGKVGLHEWECQLPNGVRFTASPGTTEFARRWDPKEGDIVSFKHHGYLVASKKPKLPVLYRLRTDLIWQDVVNNWIEKKPSFTAWPFKRPERRVKPKGYWTNIDNLREFLDGVAAELGFPADDPTQWEKVTASQISALKGGALFPRYGTLANALKKAYPDMKVKDKEIDSKPRGYWADINNRKDFFLKVAEEMQFDPTKAESWEQVTLPDIVTRKGAGLLARYGDSLKLALLDTFPELQFSESKRKRKGYWADVNNCKQFLLELADRLGFDPNVEENWRLVTHAIVLSNQGSGLLARYGSLDRVLKETLFNK